MKVKHEIHTDLPLARALHFESVEQDFCIAFGLNWHHPMLEMDEDDCTCCFRHDIKIFEYFWFWIF